MSLRNGLVIKVSSKGNPWHDARTGRFCSGPSASSYAEEKYGSDFYDYMEQKHPFLAGLSREDQSLYIHGYEGKIKNGEIEDYIEKRGDWQAFHRGYYRNHDEREIRYCARTTQGYDKVTTARLVFDAGHHGDIIGGAEKAHDWLRDTVFRGTHKENRARKTRDVYNKGR